MKRLYRNKKEYKIAGVCSGIGDYFEIDPIIVRLIFLLTFFLGAGPIVYIIGWIIIPVKDYPPPYDSPTNQIMRNKCVE